MSADDSIFNATLDLLAQLREQIADGKVHVSGYSIERDHSTFVYRIKVYEVSKP